MNITTLAFEIANTQHKGQFRKDNITPYIEHPHQVVNILTRHLTSEWNQREAALDPKWQEKNILGLPLHFMYVGVTAAEYIATGWLHDVIEDCDITKENLINSFLQFAREGEDKTREEIITFTIKWFNVIDAVELLSKKPGQNYISYLKGIKDNQLAKLVKLADLKHNMSDLKPGNLLEKYQISEWFLQQ
jgi:(p)ppGpp synthase/HD superfamily hydrolase